MKDFTKINYGLISTITISIVAGTLIVTALDKFVFSKYMPSMSNSTMPQMPQMPQVPVTE